MRKLLLLPLLLCLIACSNRTEKEAIYVSSEEVIKDFNEDIKSAKEKYRNRDVIITGEMVYKCNWKGRNLPSRDKASIIYAKTNEYGNFSFNGNDWLSVSLDELISNTINEGDILTARTRFREIKQPALSKHSLGQIIYFYRGKIINHTKNESENK